MPTRMHDDEVHIVEGVVHRLLEAQLPDLAHLPLDIVEPWGTDNAIWRLSPELVVRLPRIAWAQGQPDKDAMWLPWLAPHLPVELPVPVAVGRPDDEYPFPWAVHRWIPGVAASPDTIEDPVRFGLDLADVVRDCVPSRSTAPQAGGARRVGGAPVAARGGDPATAGESPRHGRSHVPCPSTDRRLGAARPARRLLPAAGG